MLFAGKYGKEFVVVAAELMPECGVNRQLIELLSVRAPGPDVKLKLLKEIALEHELEWDPSAWKDNKDAVSCDRYVLAEDMPSGRSETSNYQRCVSEIWWSPWRWWKQ
ncbi:PREDICTED: uncharacterized protein LOC109184865 [Ipomoea nil]|uniref:uncharacterized protein LOC109184865 n=1 Tax=Ipomoea nil TaxID=35883 RepID=UPI000900DA81|nr:PREDICTED: uncharacterized protein LOC109184865 [Ipomoea nil]